MTTTRRWRGADVSADPDETGSEASVASSDDVVALTEIILFFFTETDFYVQKLVSLVDKMFVGSVVYPKTRTSTNQ